MKFFVPLMCSTLFQQLYNVTDSMVVGKFVSKNALAAVGCTGTLNWLLISFIIGFASGEGVLVAQAFGRKDEKYMHRCIANGIYVVAAVAFVITFFSALFAKDILLF